MDDYVVELTEEEVSRFHDGIVTVLDSGMLAVEAEIALAIGQAAFVSMFERWLHQAKDFGLGAGCTHRATRGHARQRNRLAPEHAEPRCFRTGGGKHASQTPHRLRSSHTRRRCASAGVRREGLL